ncbi:hypothetical protein O0L34_g7959 [Tuta absoluta]|nr:hypothetical protein O0L34_g7959 [Tuta absoluta]
MSKHNEISDEEFVPFLHSLGVETYKKSFEWMLGDPTFAGVFSWLYNNLDINNALTAREEYRHAELKKLDKLLTSEDLETTLSKIQQDFPGICLPGDQESLEDVKSDITMMKERLHVLEKEEKVLNNLIKQNEATKDQLTIEVTKLNGAQQQYSDDETTTAADCLTLAEEVENLTDGVIDVIADTLDMYANCHVDKDIAKKFLSFGPLEPYRQSQALFRSHFNLYTTRKFSKRQNDSFSDEDLRSALVEARSLEDRLTDAALAYIESKADLCSEQSKLEFAARYTNVHPSQIAAFSLEAQSAVELLVQEESVLDQQVQTAVKELATYRTQLAVDTATAAARSKREQINADLTHLSSVCSEAVSCERALYWALRHELRALEESAQFAAQLRAHARGETAAIQDRAVSVAAQWYPPVSVCSEAVSCERALYWALRHELRALEESAQFAAQLRAHARGETAAIQDRAVSVAAQWYPPVSVCSEAVSCERALYWALRHELRALEESAQFAAQLRAHARGETAAIQDRAVSVAAQWYPPVSVCSEAVSCERALYWALRHELRALEESAQFAAQLRAHARGETAAIQDRAVSVAAQWYPPVSVCSEAVSCERALYWALRHELRALEESAQFAAQLRAHARGETAAIQDRAVSVAAQWYPPVSVCSEAVSCERALYWALRHELRALEESAQFAAQLRAHARGETAAIQDRAVSVAAQWYPPVSVCSEAVSCERALYWALRHELRALEESAQFAAQLRAHARGETAAIQDRAVSVAAQWYPPVSVCSEAVSCERALYWALRHELRALEESAQFAAQLRAHARGETAAIQDRAVSVAAQWYPPVSVCSEAVSCERALYWALRHELRALEESAQFAAQLRAHARGETAAIQDRAVSVAAQWYPPVSVCSEAVSCERALYWALRHELRALEESAQFAAQLRAHARGETAAIQDRAVSVAAQWYPPVSVCSEAVSCERALYWALRHELRALEESAQFAAQLRAHARGETAAIQDRAVSVAAQWYPPVSVCSEAVSCERALYWALRHELRALEESAQFAAQLRAHARGETAAIQDRAVSVAAQWYPPVSVCSEAVSCERALYWALRHELRALEESAQFAAQLRAHARGETAAIQDRAVSVAAQWYPPVSVCSEAVSCERALYWALRHELRALEESAQFAAQLRAHARGETAAIQDRAVSVAAQWYPPVSVCSEAVSCERALYWALRHELRALEESAQFAAQLRAHARGETAAIQDRAVSVAAQWYPPVSVCSEAVSCERALYWALRHELRALEESAQFAAQLRAHARGETAAIQDRARALYWALRHELRALEESAQFAAQLRAHARGETAAIQDRAVSVAAQWYPPVSVCSEAVSCERALYWALRHELRALEESAQFAAQLRAHARGETAAIQDRAVSVAAQWYPPVSVCSEAVSCERALYWALRHELRALEESAQFAAQLRAHARGETAAIQDRAVSVAAQWYPPVSVCSEAVSCERALYWALRHELRALEESAQFAAQLRAHARGETAAIQDRAVSVAAQWYPPVSVCSEAVSCERALYWALRHELRALEESAQFAAQLRAHARGETAAIQDRAVSVAAQWYPPVSVCSEAVSCERALYWALRHELRALEESAQFAAQLRAHARGETAAIQDRAVSVAAQWYPPVSVCSEAVSCERALYWALRHELRALEESAQFAAQLRAHARGETAAIQDRAVSVAAQWYPPVSVCSEAVSCERALYWALRHELRALEESAQFAAQLRAHARGETAAIQDRAVSVAAQWYPPVSVCSEAVSCERALYWALRHELRALEESAQFAAQLRAHARGETAAIQDRAVSVAAQWYPPVSVCSEAVSCERALYWALRHELRALEESAQFAAQLRAHARGETAAIQDRAVSVAAQWYPPVSVCSEAVSCERALYWALRHELRALEESAQFAAQLRAHARGETAAIQDRAVSVAAQWYPPVSVCSEAVSCERALYWALRHELRALEESAQFAAQLRAHARGETAAIQDRAVSVAAQWYPPVSVCSEAVSCERALYWALRHELRALEESAQFAAQLRAHARGETAAIQDRAVSVAAQWYPPVSVCSEAVSCERALYWALRHELRALEESAQFAAQLRAHARGETAAIQDRAVSVAAQWYPPVSVCSEAVSCERALYWALRHELRALEESAQFAAQLRAHARGETAAIQDRAVSVAAQWYPPVSVCSEAVSCERALYWALRHELRALEESAQFAAQLRAHARGETAAIQDRAVSVAAQWYPPVSVCSEAVSCERALYWALRHELRALEESAQFAAQLRAHARGETAAIQDRAESMKEITSSQEQATLNLTHTDTLVSYLFSCLGRQRDDDVTALSKLYGDASDLKQIRADVEQTRRDRERQLRQFKASIQPLKEYIYSGCTRQPASHDRTLTALTHSLKQELDRVEKTVLELGGQFTQVKSGDKDGMRKLWQWFLTDPPRLLAAVKTVQAN